jgi:hypothetical protein
MLCGWLMHMTRLVIRLALPLFILLAATLTLIRAQPYDDHGLRDMLLPADCAAPCFMGIKPGVTTLATAIYTLENHPWVRKVTVEPGCESPNTIIQYCNINWTWNDHLPMWINPQTNGVLTIATGRVSQFMVVPMRIELGNLWLAIGFPFTWYSVANDVYSATHPSVGLVITTRHGCSTPSQQAYRLTWYINVRDTESLFSTRLVRVYNCAIDRFRHRS